MGCPIRTRIPFLKQQKENVEEPQIPVPAEYFHLALSPRRCHDLFFGAILSLRSTCVQFSLIYIHANWFFLRDWQSRRAHVCGGTRCGISQRLIPVLVLAVDLCVSIASRRAWSETHMGHHRQRLQLASRSTCVPHIDLRLLLSRCSFSTRHHHKGVFLLFGSNVRNRNLWFVWALIYRYLWQELL